jgi:hypothetical protein
MSRPLLGSVRIFRLPTSPTLNELKAVALNLYKYYDHRILISDISDSPYFHSRKLCASGCGQLSEVTGYGLGDRV